VSLRPIALGLGVLVAASCSNGGSLAHDGGNDGGGIDSGANAGDPAATLRSELLGAWAFDGDGTDRSGQELGLAVDGLSFAAGKFGTGAQFAGTNGSPIAHRPVNDPSLDLTSGDFTVSFWINFAHTGSAQFAVIKGYVAEQGWFVG